MQNFLKQLPDEVATLSAGEAIAHLFDTQSTEAITLHINLLGDLGAGKTTLVRGVLRGLGYSGRVKSPTYPLLETYQVGALSIAHFDLYRLEAPIAFVDAGFEDYFVGPGIRLVEWPAQAGSYLPQADWQVALSELPSGGRQLAIKAETAPGQAILSRLSL